MYVMREVLSCRPGKVGALLEKFRRLSSVLERHGHAPFRLLTDVSGERFWTVVAETQAESVDAFFDMESQIMGEKEAQEIMAGYHDLVIEGRREIYKLQS